MAQSQNKTVEFTCKASHVQGLTTTGNIMIGDKAFEYYNVRNTEDFIQIPWDEIDHVEASLIGKHIPRFAIYTKQNGYFTFSARDNKAVLRAVREHVPAERIVRAASFFRVVKLGLVAVGRMIVSPFAKKKN